MNNDAKTMVSSEGLERLIASRRTVKPADFDGRKPDRELLRHCLEVARMAPNHHRTEPTYFYLLGRRQIKEVAQVNAERVAGENPTEYTLKRAMRKEKEWSESPGLLVITCHTNLGSELVRSKPAVVDEDYATSCCITQNLLLLLHNHGIATKWSTAPVWEDKRFEEIVGLRHGEPDERVVALVFLGYVENNPNVRPFRPIGEILIDGADCE
ncbi:MAG: hypothetical protein CMI30_05560 [Opitutae bacterium]|nr:hypothetical protein [Opitutae bacterium]|tara:strand:+ start:904 stop:1539 length:636 start_codon:yes stop_codon:yes gene_type:complete